MTQESRARLDDVTEQSIRRMYASLRRFAAVTGPPETDPDDLVQEALFRTLRAVGLAELQDPEAYIRRVIVNLSSNDRRSRGRTRRGLDRLMAAVPADGRRDDYPSDLADLWALAPRARAVLYLSEVERVPHAEIATSLGITESQSRKLASTARRRLREHIEDESA